MWILAILLALVLCGWFCVLTTSNRTRPSPRPSLSGLRGRGREGGVWRGGGIRTPIRTFAHQGGRTLISPSILRIPAHRSALAGTFDSMAWRLRERLSMHNGGGQMNDIHARAGPCRASFCENLPPHWGLFLRAGTGLRRGAAVIPQLLRAFRFRTSDGDAIDDMRISQDYADLDIHLGSNCIRSHPQTSPRKPTCWPAPRQVRSEPLCCQAISLTYFATSQPFPVSDRGRFRNLCNELRRGRRSGAGGR